MWILMITGHECKISPKLKLTRVSRHQAQWVERLWWFIAAWDLMWTQLSVGAKKTKGPQISPTAFNGINYLHIEMFPESLNWSLFTHQIDTFLHQPWAPLNLTKISWVGCWYAGPTWCGPLCGDLYIEEEGRFV